MRRSPRHFGQGSKPRVSGQGLVGNVTVVEKVLEHAAVELKASYGTAFDLAQDAVVRLESRRRDSIAKSLSGFRKRTNRIARTIAVLDVLKSDDRRDLIARLHAEGDREQPIIRQQLGEVLRNIERSYGHRFDIWTPQGRTNPATSGVIYDIVRNKLGERFDEVQLAQAYARNLRKNVRMAISPLLIATPLDLREAVLGSPAAMERVVEFEKRTYFVALTKTKSGQRIVSKTAAANKLGPESFEPDPEIRRAAIAALKAANVEVVFEGALGVTVALPAGAASEILATKLRLDVTDAGKAEDSRLDADLLYVRPADGTTVPGGRFSQWVDDFVFLPAVAGFATSPKPPLPTPSYPHLAFGEMQRLLDAPALSSGAQSSWTGRGIKVAVIDTGVDATHPAFGPLARNITPVTVVDDRGSTYSNGNVDSDGHGTGMAWCVLAMAPEAEVLSVAHGHRPDWALEQSSDAGADILCCPWGMPYPEREDNYLHLLIRLLVARGKILIFAAGNGNRAWPGEVPDVISVGGVYIDGNGTCRPSTFTSVYSSSTYAGRDVPDVCGISGDMPSGVFLPLPCPAGSKIDHRFALPFPDGDETAPDDGWIYASGSSAATAQISGIAALLCQKARDQGKSIDQKRVKNWLVSGSNQVTSASNSSFGGLSPIQPSPPHPGIVSATKSLACV